MPLMLGLSGEIYRIVGSSSATEDSSKAVRKYGTNFECIYCGKGVNGHGEQGLSDGMSSALEMGYTEIYASSSVRSKTIWRPTPSNQSFDSDDISKTAHLA